MNWVPCDAISHAWLLNDALPISCSCIRNIIQQVPAQHRTLSKLIFPGTKKFFFKSNEKMSKIMTTNETLCCRNTWRNPLKGANPVPGPIIIIGTLESEGSLKLDCLTKMGAQLQSLFSSDGTAFCKWIKIQFGISKSSLLTIWTFRIRSRKLA